MTEFKSNVERVYKDAGDKFVKCVVLYAGEQNDLFYDADHTEAVNKDVIMDMYMTGIQIVTGNATLAAVACSVSTYGTVTVAVSTAGDSGKFYTSEKV